MIRPSKRFISTLVPEKVMTVNDLRKANFGPTARAGLRDAIVYLHLVLQGSIRDEGNGIETQAKGLWALGVGFVSSWKLNPTSAALKVRVDPRGEDTNALQVGWRSTFVQRQGPAI
jgi:hypothetical protein